MPKVSPSITSFSKIDLLFFYDFSNETMSEKVLVLKREKFGSNANFQTYLKYSEKNCT